jgi:NAD(P)-dependent dehydrogenase (short-subunit alcohol dehydrogenase family)
MAANHVLVTGASTGIGEACALHLDRLGWRVFAGVRKDADGTRLQEQAGARGRLTPILLDVTDEAQVNDALAAIGDAVGSDGLAGLVNNAGVARGGPLEFLPMSEWRDQLDVNVFGQIAVTKAAIPLIRKATGRIVFIGSIAGRVAAPMIGPYAASKHAIEAIGAALREELLPWDLKVIVVEPGIIKTPIWAKGRSKAEELEASLGDDARRLYRGQMDNVRTSIEKNDKKGVPASKVAEAVEHALTSPRPKLRYLVGTDAKVAGNLARIVPDRAWAGLSRKLLEL